MTMQSTTSLEIERAAWFLLVLPPSVAFAVSALSDSPDPLVMIFAPIAALFFLSIAVRRAHTLAQQLRNRRAQNALIAAHLGEKRRDDVILFLRSFSLDDKFGDDRVEDVAHGPRSAGAQAGALAVTVLTGVALPSIAAIAARDAARLQAPMKRYEFYLLKVARKSAPRALPCSVGRPTIAQGFGRIITDDSNWKGDVTALLHSARLVMMMFGPGAGTSWELEQILSSPELLSRTIFVIPPKSKVLGGSDLEQYYLERDYKELARRFKDMNVTVPEYQEDIAFVVESNGLSKVDVGFVDGKPWELIRWLRLRA